MAPVDPVHERGAPVAVMLPVGMVRPLGLAAKVLVVIEAKFVDVFVAFTL